MTYARPATQVEKERGKALALLNRLVGAWTEYGSDSDAVSRIMIEAAGFIATTKAQRLAELRKDT